uniref:unspecific monooxygenase n=1 Tax=Gasterosteus aculeatus aculeatus TaxID=481459 RepID=A0AAQ4R8S3_GASAC
MGFLPELSIQTWTLIVFLVTLITVYGYAPYGFFKKLGIPGPRPLPFIGTFLEYRKGIHNFDTECYEKYGKVWGIYDGRVPILVTMDTAMIKSILVKECYSNFTNRRDFGLNGALRDAITVVEDEEWKRIRSILSPSFTSGRLKEMYSIMLQHSGNLIKSLHKKAEAGEVVDVKDIFGPYSMDVVASTAFSVDIDSINNPSDPFVANIRKLVKFTFLTPLFLLLGMSNVGFLKTIKSDRSKNEHKVIFIQCFMWTLRAFPERICVTGLSDSEILSQAMIFIFAGYETSSGTLGFLAYNLATNPDIQKTLQEEIDETFPNKARPTYDALMQMEYLDMVLNESMRLYPSGNRLDRVSKSSVEIEGVTIPKGTVVMIPVYTLHREPTLWPEPDDFKPERFSKENKDSIDPYSYLPFGAGPRNCIGMRFALLMMKLSVVEILQNFSFVTCKETQIPLELSTDGFTTPKDSINLKLEPRGAHC